MMDLIDSHCHLIDERFADVASVIERANASGVSKMIMPVGNLAEAKSTIQLAEKYGQYAMVGIHPEEVEDLYRFRVKPGMTGNEIANVQGEPRLAPTVVDETMLEMRALIKSSKRVVGVGEIGLDFFVGRDKNNPFRQGFTDEEKEKQIEVFERQMALALELKLPVVIHMRDAEEEMLTVMNKMKDLPTGQFHCFAGSKIFLEYILKRGFCMSFAGNITYKSAGNLRDLTKLVPLDRLLLETDSPYLSPEPLRGTVNEPAIVKIIAEFIASELGITPDLLAEATTKNAICLYCLDI